MEFERSIMFEHYYILYTKKEPKIVKTKTSIKFSETHYRYGKIDENNKKAFWDNFGKTESLKTNQRERLTLIQKIDRFVNKLCFPLIAISYSTIIFYGVYAENNLLVIWAGFLSLCFSAFFSSFFEIKFVQPIKNWIFKKFFFDFKVMSILVLLFSVIVSFVLLGIYQVYWIDNQSLIFKSDNIGNTATLISLIIFFADKSIEYNHKLED